MDKWKLCCHHVNDTHGPRATGNCDRLMLAVAQDPYKSKSRDEAKRVYGCW